jgi:hypothetical protein
MTEEFGPDFNGLSVRRCFDTDFNGLSVRRYLPQIVRSQTDEFGTDFNGLPVRRKQIVCPSISPSACTPATSTYMTEEFGSDFN